MKTAPSEKVTLFGVPIDNLNMAEVLDRIESMIGDGGIHQHVVVNVDKIVKMESNASLRQTVLDCDLITVNGQPIIWVSKLFKCPIKERVTGVDLFDALMGRCAERGLRPYLLGARQEIVAKTVDALKGKYPKLQLAGWRNGYWTADEEARIVQGIKEAKTGCTLHGCRVAKTGAIPRQMETGNACVICDGGGRQL